MTFDSLVATLSDPNVTLPLVCSLAAGAAIGLEREYNGKPAGLRTHTLVCFASAMMTLVGLRTADWATRLPADVQIVMDMARMPHAILTGIGFLGAGVIFREGPSVQGLTTAASLWLSAALGIVFGAGLLEIGLLGAAAVLAILTLFRVLQWITPPRPEVRLEFAVRSDSSFDTVRLRALLREQDLLPGPLFYPSRSDSRDPPLCIAGLAKEVVGRL